MIEYKQAFAFIVGLQHENNTQFSLDQVSDGGSSLLLDRLSCTFGVRLWRQSIEILWAALGSVRDGVQSLEWMANDHAANRIGVDSLIESLKSTPT